MGAVSYRMVTIASGAALSGEVDIKDFTLLGIIMPAAWTAAALTFQAAVGAGGTFQDVYDDTGAEVSVTAAASQAIGVGTPVKLRALGCFQYLKVRSGTAALPVNQGADRTLTLILKEP